MSERIVILVGTLLVLSVMGGGIVLGQDADTNVNNVAPTVDDTSVPDPLAPKAANTLTATIGDDNKLSDVQNVTIILYRDDVSEGAADSLRNHYTIKYSNDQATTGTVSLSPTPGSSDNASVTLNSGLDNSSVQDQLSVDFTPEEIAAPSLNTVNSTVNDYTWQMVVYAYDRGVNTGTTTNTTNVTTRTNLVVNASLISTTGSPGQTDTQYSPNLNQRNDGNVELDIDYSATDQSRDGGGPDTIPANNLKVNDANSAGGATAYSTTTQTYQADIAYDSDTVIYNWVDIPNGIQSGTYSGTVTYTAAESAAS